MWSGGNDVTIVCVLSALVQVLWSQGLSFSLLYADKKPQIMLTHVTTPMVSSPLDR